MYTLLIAGLAYIAFLFAIANLYLPIAYIAIAYAIAGLAYRVANQVSLTVEKWREQRYNANMRTRTDFGLTVEGAFRALREGTPVYCVAFEPQSTRLSEYSPIAEGAWLAPEGTLYLEPCLITPFAELARAIAFAERQRCILRLALDWSSDERVYLYVDTPANRGYSLSNAGGYTADGKHILTYSEHFLPHYLAEGDVAFLPVKGEFVPITE